MANSRTLWSCANHAFLKSLLYLLGALMFFPNRFTATIAVVLFLLPFSAMADQVVMKNGDVITGNISMVTDEDVFIEPGYADEFSVSLSEVASLVIEESLEVELADSTVINGSIGVNSAGEQVIINDGVETPFSLTDIARAKEPDPHFDWSAQADWSSTLNQGNTDSQTTLMFLRGDMKVGDHRHYGDLTFRREEVNSVSTKEQDLLNYSYNWFFSDPWFVGGSFTYERDPIRDLDHRYTAGLLFGRDIFDDAHKFLTISLGAGYSDEEIGGVSTSGAVALWNLRYTHKLWSGVNFFHDQNFTQQFYGVDNTIFKTNTGFMFDLVSDLYATVSLRYDYETDPAAGASKDDSTLAIGLGYSF